MSERAAEIKTDAMFAGVAIGGFYLAILFYQMSWQHYFGFEYINLSVDEIVYTGRHLFIPLGCAITLFGAFRHYILDGYKFGQLLSTALFAPLLTVLIYIINSATPTSTSIAGIFMFLMLYFSAIFARYSSEAGIFYFKNKVDKDILLLGALIGLSGSVVLAFSNVGRSHAATETEFEMIEKNGARAVVLMRDGDIVMAATLDTNLHLIKREFIWMKLDKDALTTRKVNLSDQSLWAQ